MKRILELRFEVLVDAEEEIHDVLDDAFESLYTVKRIIEVDTADVKNLGLWDDYLKDFDLHDDYLQEGGY